MFGFLGTLFGGQKSAATAESTPLAPVGPAPQRPLPFRDQIWSDVWPQPYRGPLDLDRYGGETSEMRLAFRELYRRESFIKASIEGKAASVAALDLVVIPADKERPEDRRAAEFVKWSIEDSRDGSDGLIRSMLVGGFVDGWSLGNLKLRIVDGHGRWRGLAGLDHVRWLDTAYMRLQLDQFRNLVGVVNTVRGLEDYDPSTCVLFTHNELFTNPFGQADMRSVYRDANILEDAMYLWRTGARVFGLPVAVGKVDAKDGSARFQQMYDALQDMRAAGVIVCPKSDDVDILNIASATSLESFNELVQSARESIVTGIRGAYLPFMQGQGSGETRGSAGVGKHAGSDPGEYLLAKAVGRVLTRQVAPHLVRLNFPTAGIPRVILGGVNWAETKSQLDVIQEAKALGLKVSAKHVHEITQIPPPDDPEDELRGPDDPPPGSGGDPGPGGIPAIAPASTGTAPAPTPPAPAPDAGSGSQQQFAATPATPFRPGDAARYAEFFLPTRHGHFPGDMHEQFGLDVAQFAAATGLFRKAVRRGGQTGWAWAAKPATVAAAEPPPAPAPPPAATFSALPAQSTPPPAAAPLGPVVQVPTARLLADPARFQFRRGHDAEDGTVRDLPAETFDRAKCPPLAAWRDPADGGEYVVDGHHRLAWAERDGVTRVPVRWIGAKTAEEARAIGERLNREQPAPAPIPTPVAARVPLPQVAEDEFDLASAATFSDGDAAVFAADRKSPANGRYKDSLGRARCYRDGKQVPCADHPDAEHEVAKHVESAREHLTKTGPITHDDVKAMAHHLERMTVPELKRFQAEFLESPRGKQVKAQRVKTLLDWAKNERIGAKDVDLDMDFDTDETIGREKKSRDPEKDPVKDRADRVLPVRNRPPVDYRHKDANHPVVREMMADTALTAKVAAFHAAAKASVEALDADRKATKEVQAAVAAYNEALNAPDGQTPEGRKREAAARKAYREANERSKATNAAYRATLRPKRERFLETFSVPNPSTLKGDVLDPKVRSQDGHEAPIRAAEAFVGRVTAGMTAPYRVMNAEDGRACYRDLGGLPEPMIGFGNDLATRGQDAATATHAHELGHMVEYRKPGVQERAKAFLAYRVGDETPVRMDSLPGAKGYGPDELGRKDNFDRAIDGNNAYYVGKQYRDGATEIISMGVEQMYKDPERFVLQDPEYFHFILSVLK